MFPVSWFLDYFWAINIPLIILLGAWIYLVVVALKNKIKIFPDRTDPEPAQRLYTMLKVFLLVEEHDAVVVPLVEDLERLRARRPPVQPLGMGQVQEAVEAGVHHQQGLVKGRDLLPVIQVPGHGCCQGFPLNTQFFGMHPDQDALQGVGHSTLDDETRHVRKVARRMKGVDRADRASEKDQFVLGKAHGLDHPRDVGEHRHQPGRAAGSPRPG